MGISRNKKLDDLTLDEKIGQLFVAGFPDQKPSTEFLSLIREEKVGNIILFSHNISDKFQLAKLNRLLYNEIIDATGVVPIISIDEEGGVVTRLPKESAIMPSQMAQAATGDKNLVYGGAKIIGEQLKALGINMNLAPLLDINSNPNNPVIGVRSFGETKECVCEYAKEAVKGYKEAGILCSGKHFPGHGDTEIDSHLGLPVIERSWNELENRELHPFKELIKQQIPAITIAHVVVSSMESRHIPSTVSKDIITDYLRNTLNYSGIIISDCMEMEAMKQFGTIEENVVSSLQAGIDLIFISHTSALAKRAVKAVRKAVADGILSIEQIDKSVSRILTAKEKLPSLDFINPDKVGTKQQIDFAQSFLKKTIQGSKKEKMVFHLGDNPVFIGVIPSRVTKASSTVKMEQDFSSHLKMKYGGTAVTLSLNPTEEELEYAKEKLNNHSSVVVGVLNANLHEGQKKLLQLIDQVSYKTALISLRNPYDRSLIAKEVFYLSLYEYSERTLKELADYFVQ